MTLCIQFDVRAESLGCECPLTHLGSHFSLNSLAGLWQREAIVTRGMWNHSGAFPVLRHTINVQQLKSVENTVSCSCFVLFILEHFIFYFCRLALVLPAEDSVRVSSGKLSLPAHMTGN